MTTFTEASKGMSRSEEATLVEKVRRGDRRATRVLVDLHKDRLYAFVHRVMGHHHDSEEVCQEAFLRAFSALDTFSTQYRFSTWLFTIAYRVCLNTLRRRKTVTTELEFNALGSVDDGPEEHLAESEAAREARHAVWEAVDGLTTPQKAAVLLFYRQDQNCQEIAEIMQVPVATVKSHLHRARARLKDLLAEKFGQDAAASGRMRIAAG